MAQWISIIEFVLLFALRALFCLFASFVCLVGWFERSHVGLLVGCLVFGSVVVLWIGV